MSDPINDIIEEADEIMEETSGKKNGARDRFFIMASWHQKKMILTAIQANSLDEAHQKFFDEYGFKPNETLDGEGNGFYIAKGTGMSDVQRISVTVTPEQLMRRTTKAFKAEFKDWEVFASGLKRCMIGDQTYEDNELVSVEFSKPIGDKKISKPKLKKREVVRLIDLSNIQELNT